MKTVQNQHEMRKDNLKLKPLSHRNHNFQKSDSTLSKTTSSDKPKLGHLSNFFGNYKLWKLRQPKKDIEDEGQKEEEERLWKLKLLNQRLLKKNVSDVMEQLIELISINTDSNDRYNKMMTENVIPYFAEVSKSYIVGAKDLIDNYLKYQYNLHKDLEIMSIL